jgi:hypothetical protein
MAGGSIIYKGITSIISDPNHTFAVICQHFIVDFHPLEKVLDD